MQEDGIDPIEKLFASILKDIDKSRDKWRTTVEGCLELDRTLTQLNNLVIAYLELYRTSKNMVDAYDGMCRDIMMVDVNIDYFKKFNEAREQLRSLKLYSGKFIV